MNNSAARSPPWSPPAYFPKAPACHPSASSPATLAWPPPPSPASSVSWNVTRSSHPRATRHLRPGRTSPGSRGRARPAPGGGRSQLRGPGTPTRHRSRAGAPPGPASPGGPGPTRRPRMTTIRTSSAAHTTTGQPQHLRDFAGQALVPAVGLQAVLKHWRRELQPPSLSCTRLAVVFQPAGATRTLPHQPAKRRLTQHERCECTLGRST
jgi:hypothetical protein